MSFEQDMLADEAPERLRAVLDEMRFAMENESRNSIFNRYRAVENVLLPQARTILQDLVGWGIEGVLNDTRYYLPAGPDTAEDYVVLRKHDVNTHDFSGRLTGAIGVYTVPLGLRPGTGKRVCLEVAPNYGVVDASRAAQAENGSVEANMHHPFPIARYAGKSALLPVDGIVSKKLVFTEPLRLKKPTAE